MDELNNNNIISNKCRNIKGLIVNNQSNTMRPRDAKTKDNFKFKTPVYLYIARELVNG